MDSRFGGVRFVIQIGLLHLGLSAAGLAKRVELPDKSHIGKLRHGFPINLAAPPPFDGDEAGEEVQ